MNINNIKTIFIHSGLFNVDDVIATAIIMEANPSVAVSRVSVCPVLKDGETALSFGFPSFLGLDGIDDSPSLTESAWFGMGLQILAARGFNSIKEADEDFCRVIVDQVNDMLRSKLDFIPSIKESKLIFDFLPKRGEDYDDTMCDSLFFKAVSFTRIVLSNWLRASFQRVEKSKEEKQIWENAKKASTDGIYVLEKNIPWQTFVYSKEGKGAKIIVYQSTRGGFHIEPTEMSGLKVKPNANLTFVHPTGFMGSAATMENAILAAKDTLAQLH